MSASKNMVIFYTDDDRDDLDTFKDAVSEIDCSTELHTMDGGDKLLHALENPPPKPHMVFLDLNMPGKNGFEVIQELRLSNNFRHLPIVVLSTATDEESINQSLSLGANLYITKPSDYAQLKASVTHAMNMDWSTFVPNTNNFVYKH
jgi:response regulator RpfG family c-di-GMP phosphodiesterase